MADVQNFTSLFSLKDRVIIVAGGSGGIGSVISEGFASFGAAVVIWDYALDKAQTLAEAIQKRHPSSRVTASYLDAKNVQGIKEQLQPITEIHGRADVLVNCVGTHIEQPAEEFTEEQWDTVVSLNLKSAFFLSQAVANQQIAHNTGGRHIHISSVRSALGLRRGYSAYCASKGGLNMLIKQLSTEWAAHGIRVNGIAPTFTRTPLVSQYVNDPVFMETLIARIPAGRICETTDLAGIAAFLSMPISDYITGQVIFADGGLTAAQ